MVNHHLAKYIGHRHFGSEAINIPANIIIFPLLRDFKSVTVYACLLPSLLISLKQMAWHALKHEISD